MTTQATTTQATCSKVVGNWKCQHPKGHAGRHGTMIRQEAVLDPRPLGTAEALLISSTADVNRWARIAATRPLTAQEARMQRNAQDQAIQDRSLVEALKEADATARRQALIARVGSRVSPATDPARFGTITQVVGPSFVFVRWDDCCPCGGVNADPARLIPAYDGPRCANCAAPVPGPWNVRYNATGARSRLCPTCLAGDPCCYTAL